MRKVRIGERGNYMIQKLIKEKQYDEIIKYYTGENINEIDKFGRTILHNLIINKLPLDIFKDMIDKGANPYLKDKSGQNAMIKAIKFKDVDVIKYLINYGFELNSDIGIIDTPWFFARNNYNIADLLIATYNSIRLRLYEEEKQLIDDLLYDEECFSKLNKLNTSELIHGYILEFNYDDDLKPIKYLLENPICKEITAIEVFQLLDGRYLLEHEKSEYDENAYELIEYILSKYPQINNYYRLGYL